MDRASKPATGPSTLAMVTEAIQTIDDKKGASVSAIKSFIIGKYQADPSRLKTHLKKALEKGLQTGVLKRPKSLEGQTGASLNGRYKLDKENIAAKAKQKLKPKVAAEKKAIKPKSMKPSAKTAADQSPKSPKPKKPNTVKKTEKSPKKLTKVEKSPKKLTKTKTPKVTQKSVVKKGQKVKDTPDPRPKKVKVKQPKAETKTPKKSTTVKKSKASK